MKGQEKPAVDEFAFILLGAVIFIAILAFVLTPTSEPKPLVEPRSIVLRTLNGSSRAVEIVVYGNNTQINMSSEGIISGWVDFSPESFSVSGSKRVTIYFDVPKTAFGSYSGKIILKYIGGEVEIPVSVEVTREITEILSSRLIEPFGEFRLVYSIPSQVIAENSDIYVYRGVFDGNSVSLVGNLSDTSKIKRIYLEFLIEESNKKNDLVVKVNDDVLYKGKGYGLIQLNLTPQKIYNVEFSCGGPGLAFWSETYYKIKYAKIVAEMKSEASKEFTFSLADKEIDNFDHFRLSVLFDKQGTTMPLKDLEIRINNKIVYKGKPPITALIIDIEKDILGNPLYLKNENTIEFKILEGGSYSISSAELEVYYLS